jgi:putative oxygen-independent coproporphyrinogen III oxidase
MNQAKSIKSVPIEPRFDTPPPLGLYIHLPWCVRKCPYCDFNSHELGDEAPYEAYVDALLADLEQDLPLIWGRPVRTVFIGGGTPSLFPPRAIERLLTGVRARLRLSPGAEITLEANPGTVDLERLCGFRDAGVNRISLGIQSLDDDALKRIGRIHGAAEALAAAEAIASAGFQTWNIDLMYGLPSQSLEGAVADVRAAIGLEPSHISHYQLTLEPHTAFYAHPPVTPDDDALWEMQVTCQAELASAGFYQYETSAYAREGRLCAHNLNYWRFGDYLGIGAGAHTKITRVDEQTVHRYSKVRHPEDYIQGKRPSRIAETRALTADDLAFEFMMNALRLNEGFEPALFQERTGIPLTFVEKQLARAEAMGLIGRQTTRIWPTDRGRRYLNDLLLMLLPDRP